MSNIAAVQCNYRRRLVQFEMPDRIDIDGLVGLSAGRRVFLGFAPANVLHALSFADILDEGTGRGYQRRLNPQHSLDFRKYVQKSGSTTIPLTFNLRPEFDGCWNIIEKSSPSATLKINKQAGKILAQVDCQHRLGYLSDIEISLPFMCFLGLSEREETEIFCIINSKAKGLSTSLLDFHDATLTNDLATEKPELLIALYLNNSRESPWYRQLDLGGATTSGLLRRASLRTMQKAIRRFLGQTKILQRENIEGATRIVLDFWTAVAIVLQDEWESPRKHLINKGVGVYALMGIAGDLYLECFVTPCNERYFVSRMSEFISDIDWTTDGPLKGLGGESGVSSALNLIRSASSKRKLKVVINGQ
jgi:DNA sulfur modification protein DndB